MKYPTRSGPLKIGTRDLGSCDDLGAKLLLQALNQVLDEERESTFRRWYPDLCSKLNRRLRERICPRNLALSDTTRDLRMRMNHFFMAWRRSGPDTCASLREDFSLCSRAAAACAWHSKRAGQRRSRTHFSVPGQFPKPLADLVERQVDRAGDVASFELIGISHVHDLGTIACERSPVGKREVSPQVIG